MLSTDRIRRLLEIFSPEVDIEEAILWYKLMGQLPERLRDFWSAPSAWDNIVDKKDSEAVITKSYNDGLYFGQYKTPNQILRYVTNNPVDTCFLKGVADSVSEGKNPKIIPDID